MRECPFTRPLTGSGRTIGRAVHTRSPETVSLYLLPRSSLQEEDRGGDDEEEQECDQAAACFALGVGDDYFGVAACSEEGVGDAAGGFGRGLEAGGGGGDYREGSDVQF